MGKIGLIIQREYLTRVRKKSFILLTILGPLLIAGGISVVLWLNLSQVSDHSILVIDEKAPVFSHLKNKAKLSYTAADISIDQARKLLEESNHTGVLYIPKNIEFSNTAILYFKSQPGLNVIRTIEDDIEQVVEQLKLRQYDIDPKIYDDINTNFSLKTMKYTDAGGEESVDMEKNFVGLLFGVVIYLFIFLYGVQVMRGVIEEKTSRIVEVIICSVRPFQLMMGKIVGIALVGLTQFVAWVLLTGILVTVFQMIFFNEFLDPSMLSGQLQVAQNLQTEQVAQDGMELTNSVIHRINWPLMIALFLFYFLGGYLLYAALFAAVGAAVDNETETQQFMIPITLPLTIAYIFATTIAMNPESDMAYWMSIIPLFSPVVMLVRVAVGIGDGGVPIIDVLLSGTLLIAGFVFTTWMAGRIYKVGILMYGKRTNYRDLFKWLLKG